MKRNAGNTIPEQICQVLSQDHQSCINLISFLKITNQPILYSIYVLCNIILL